MFCFVLVFINLFKCVFVGNFSFWGVGLRIWIGIWLFIFISMDLVWVLFFKDVGLSIFISCWLGLLIYLFSIVLFIGGRVVFFLMLIFVICILFGEFIFLIISLFLINKLFCFVKIIVLRVINKFILINILLCMGVM